MDINGSSAPRRKALARRRATHENRLGLEVDAEAGEHYWVSGPRRDGADRLYGGMVEIDADAQRQYGTEIRRQPHNVELERYTS